MHVVWVEKYKTFESAAVKMHFCWTQHTYIELLNLFTALVSFLESTETDFLGIGTDTEAGIGPKPNF